MIQARWLTPGDDDPALELVLEELEDGLLHHVGHLVPLEAGAHQHQRPGGHSQPGTTKPI